MIYKQYGHTNHQVSAVGFGGMRFDLSKSLEENAELVRYAASKGITYFDTAPMYCDNMSTDIMGLAFRDMPGPFVVADKLMPVYCETKEKAREAVKRSVDRLGRPVNFFHVWCLRQMEHYHLAMKPGGLYEGLLECQAEGLIEHIVFSSHQPGDEIRAILLERKFEGVLLGMNILNYPYRWDGVQAAHEMGYGVVAMNPLAGGLIPQNEDKLGFLAQEDETPTEAALRFLISMPEISVVLNGFTTREQVDMAYRVADRCSPFTEADRERIQRHLTANMNAICTSCGYCDDCPQGISIPNYMQYYNQRQMFREDDEAMRNQLRHEHTWGLLVGQSASAVSCVECGKCEEACTQRLNIVERLREIARWEEEIGQPS